MATMATLHFIIVYLCLLLFTALSNAVKSYRAVIVIHGVLTGSDSMELISNRIEEVSKSNGTKVADVATCMSVAGNRSEMI